MRKLISEEVHRIQKLMGVKKPLIIENVGKFFEKMGVSNEKFIERLEKSGSKYSETIGKQFIEMAKKSILSASERNFLSGIVRKLFPELVEKYVTNIEAGVFRNSSAQMAQIDRLFKEPRVPTENIRNYIKAETGIGLELEGLQLWRDFRVENSPRTTSTATVADKTNARVRTADAPKVSNAPEKIKTSEPAVELKGKFVNMQGVELYHGTNFEIKSPSDLDPLFRDTEAFKTRQGDARTRVNTGSSGNYGSGTGIYFGKSATEVGPSGAKQYMQDNVYLTHGNIYSMTLASDAKVLETNVHIQTLSKEQFNYYKSKGVDAITNKGEVILLNPDKVVTWKKVDEWYKPFNVTLKDVNPATGKFEVTKQQTFTDLQSLERFYQNEMKTNKPISLQDVDAQGVSRIQDVNSNKLIIVSREVEHVTAPKVITIEPNITIEGTFNGYQVIKGAKENAIGDIRQYAAEARSQGKSSYTKETVKDGKRTFTLVDTRHDDAFGRPGFKAVSVTLPVETNVKIADVMPTLEAAMKGEKVVPIKKSFEPVVFEPKNIDAAGKSAGNFRKTDEQSTLKKLFLWFDSKFYEANGKRHGLISDAQIEQMLPETKEYILTLQNDLKRFDRNYRDGNYYSSADNSVLKTENDLLKHATHNMWGGFGRYSKFNKDNIYDKIPYPSIHAPSPSVIANLNKIFPSASNGLQVTF